MNSTNQTMCIAGGPDVPPGYPDELSNYAVAESVWEELNRTDNITKIDYFYFYEKEQLAMLWILFVSIIFGNCSVLITLTFSKGRRSRFRFFIKHLAIADLSVGLVSVLTDIIWKLTVEWKAGNIACKVVRYSQVVVTYSSTYVLVALTIDRYDAITHPMNFSRSWKRAKVLVVSAWILSFLFSTPIIVLYEEKTVEGHLQCWIDLLESWHWQIYMTLISLTVFFIPACIIATCYSIIIYTIWSKMNILTQKKMNRHAFSEVSGSNSEDTDCRRVSSRGLIPKAKIKTIKMTLIIVFVFIFCWSPYMVFDLLQVFGYIKRTQSNIALATFIQSLAPLNSAANPIIYCMFSSFVCHIQRKHFPLCLSKWCFNNTHLGTRRKISDTLTYSTHASKTYGNLHHIQRPDDHSRPNKIGRIPMPLETGYYYRTPPGKKRKQDVSISRQPVPVSAIAVTSPPGLEGEYRLGMTLKNHSGGLSERAKAFSVESLMRAGDGAGGKAGGGSGIQVITCNNITTELCSSDLWDKFSEIGTEMIVTKAGRRMFPTLKVRFHGLSSSTTYIVYMDIIPVGETRYRYIYHSSQWMPAGSSDVYSGNNLYIHPDSPATGRLWTSQGHISFDKIKLTNNKRPVMAGQISLNSMHKYQPRIHILEVPISDNLRLNNASEIIDYIKANTGRAASFTFKQTSFITVTAYQNQDITKLKIQSNPFAKGFREASKPREARINKPPVRQPYLLESTLNKSYDAEGYPAPGRDSDSNDAAFLQDKTGSVPYKYIMPEFELRDSQKCNNHKGNSDDIFYSYYR